MAPHICHTCDVLKEIYWLRVTRFILAGRSTRASAGRGFSELEVQALKDQSIDALRTLLRHRNSCHDLTVENAARKPPRGKTAA